MAVVLFNALASTAGGGITYLQNILPRLAGIAGNYQFLVLVPKQHLDNYKGYSTNKLIIESISNFGGLPVRLLWEQTRLRKLIRENSIEVLISLGNFIPVASPIPQILFNRNDLYFSDYFLDDLLSRRLYFKAAGHRLKRRFAISSIKRTDINVAPTKAFAEKIRRVPGLEDIEIEVLQFGFDDELFRLNLQPVPEEWLDRINLNGDCIRFLYVSHYNYFRNFETLIKALPVFKKTVAEKTGKKVQLVLTTDIRNGAVYGGYDASNAARLIDHLGIREDIAMLGSVPYDKLHRLYSLCDVYVCPSYSESFGHPLIEAMASGLPVISADLPVHREICGEAALYFDVFDEGKLAERCLRVAVNDELKRKLSEAGLARSRQFSWDEHLEGLIRLIDRCL